MIEKYQNNICKCKWLIDHEKIKNTLYEIHEELLGVRMQLSDISGMGEELVTTFGGHTYTATVHGGKGAMFYSLEPLQWLANQHELSIAAEAHRTTLLSYHYRYESAAWLDRYGQNLVGVVNRRLVDLGSGTARFALEQSSEAERCMLQHGTARSRTAVALFARLQQNSLSQRLINAVLTRALGFVCRQLRVQRCQRRLVLGRANTLVAPHQAGFDGRLLGLIYLAGACGCFEPAFDPLGLATHGRPAPALAAVWELLFALRAATAATDGAVFDHEAAGFLRTRQQPGATAPFRELSQAVTAEQLRQAARDAIDPDRRPLADAAALGTIAELLHQLDDLTNRYDKTVRARVFLFNLFLLDGVAVEAHQQTFDAYLA